MMMIALLIKFIYIVKESNRVKYQYLIKKRGKNGLENLKDPRAFIKYSDNMQDVFKNTENYNPSKKKKNRQKIKMNLNQV